MPTRAAVVVTALLVAGCGAEDEPARSPARTPSRPARC